VVAPPSTPPKGGLGHQNDSKGGPITLELCYGWLSIPIIHLVFGFWFFFFFFNLSLKKNLGINFLIVCRHVVIAKSLKKHY
jgi:hypothetical protein